MKFKTATILALVGAILFTIVKLCQIFVIKDYFWLIFDLVDISTFEGVIIKIMPYLEFAFAITILLFFMALFANQKKRG